MRTGLRFSIIVWCAVRENNSAKSAQLHGQIIKPPVEKRLVECGRLVYVYGGVVAKLGLEKIKCFCNKPPARLDNPAPNVLEDKPLEACISSGEHS